MTTHTTVSTDSAGAGAEPTTLRSAPRRYFEVFGEALSEIIFLRNAIIVLSGLCIVLTVILFRVATKPPIVIRVDKLTDPLAFTDVQHVANVTAPEVRNFSEHFTRYLFAWDLYTLDDDINRALAMMTSDAAIKMKDHLDGLNVTRQVKENAMRTKVTVTEISVEKDAPRVIRVRVRGTRISDSYDKKDYHKETIFEDTITARKVDRSLKTPWGLLVEDWQESIYKETP